MISALSLSAAACSAATSSKPRKALAILREPTGGRRQCIDVVDSEKGIVDLAKADLRLPQLLLDEAVAVEVVAGLKREERGHPHHHWAEHLIADIKVVVRETAALRRQDPVIGILGGVFR